MKTSLILSAILAAGLSCVLPAGAQNGETTPGDKPEAAEMVGLLPSQIAPVFLKPAERNPYERRVEEKPETESKRNSELTEEDRLRQIFGRLEVTGGVRSSKGLRVLVSDMIFSEGEEVPPVIMGQTIRLMVNSITENEIELIWMEDLGKKLPRRIILPFNLEPKVGVQLSGQTNVKKREDAVMAYQRLGSSLPPLPEPEEERAPVMRRYLDNKEELEAAVSRIGQEDE